MWEIMNIADQTRDEFIDRNIGKTFEVLIEVVKEEGKWSGWTQNYIEADETTFKITSGIIERNQIVTGILK